MTKLTEKQQIVTDESDSLAALSSSFAMPTIHFLY